MRYSVVLTPILDEDFEDGFYYAHVPTLDLTTHGKGVEGALAAAQELADAWVAEKQANDEPVPRESGALTAFVDVADAVHGT